MKDFKYKIVIVLFLLSGALVAQQDPQYSQYMFNQLAINPAYAGSREAINTAVFVRSQWTGIKGAPNTETFSISAPFRKRNMGLGFAVIADQIGPKNSVGGLLSYAYSIPIRNARLAFGLRAGVYQFTYNWDDIVYRDIQDPYNTHTQTSTIVPTADAGLYLYTNTLYMGISATHLYNGRLTSLSASTGDYAQYSAHFFFTIGKAWSFSDNLVFNPSIMIKAAKNAPKNMDVNLSFLLKEKIWLGISGRSSGALVAYTQFKIGEKFKLGYAFDFGFNKIGQAGGGTHELMLGYDFNISKSKIASPRYL